MKILITGAAGFIGFHLSKYLMNKGYKVIGIDNLNDYYDVSLKKDRLKELGNFAKLNNSEFNFKNIDIVNKEYLKKLFEIKHPKYVVHLAAQAGVRYSLINPSAYIQSNLVGFTNILEECKQHKVEHLVYASSSSVYGGNKKLPFDEREGVDHPVSLYAATKRSNELMAHTYSHLYRLPATGLRFFTVYGPWGRPDMAPMIFANSILKKLPIKIFNYGEMKRDFTYIDDIVEAIYRCIKKPATKDELFNPIVPNPSTANCPHRIFNLGNSDPIELEEFINCLENELGIKAIKEYLPIQPGDVEETAADNSALNEWIDFKPRTKLKKGIKNFANWYKDYY